MSFNFNPRHLYAQTARFDTGRALTEDEMRRAAPSIFAVAAHDSRTERFQPIPTIEVLRGLMSEGFMPVAVRQSGARDLSRREFTKHLIRLRRLDNVEKYKTGDTVCEVILKNANDGTSSFALLAALFRIACCNSLVTKTRELDSLMVRHTGNAADVAGKVIEGTYKVLDVATKVLEKPAEWSRIQLENGARQAFAEAAHVLRFADADGNVSTPIKAEQLLIPRRVEDTGRDLYSTLNVLQENALRGGLTAMGRDANGRRRRTTTREIGGIDQDVKLNKALWVLAERMAELAA